MDSRLRIRVCGGMAVAAGIGLLAANLVFAAQPTPPKPPSPAAPASEQDKVIGQLAKSWSLFFGNKCDEAIQQAEPLVKLADPKYRWVAVEAAHIQARSLWAKDTKDSQAKAQQLWKQLEKASTLTSLLTRLKIAKALQAESQAEAATPMSAKTVDPVKLAPAIDALEAILKGNGLNTATTEAAIDLSRLYVQAKRFDDAKKTLEFVVALMTDKKSLTKMEISETLAKPYVDAAKAALAHLKYDKNLGMAEFEAAENLRKAGKFPEALKAHQAVAKDFASGDYGPRSEMTVGHCLIGLKQPAQAMEHWKKFVQAKPAGPWRAQALLAMIDTFLEEQLNLPEAGKYADIAKSSLPAGLADEKAGDSWKAAAYDVNLRVGVVAFCQGKGDAAAEAFDAAKKLTTKKLEQESLDALIAAAKPARSSLGEGGAGKSVIPDYVKGSRGANVPSASPAGVSPADKAAQALSMGIIYMCADRLDRAEAFFDRVAGTPAIPAKSGSPGRPARPAMSGATPAQLAFAVFGKGAVLQAQKKPDEAKEQFLASVKAFNDGTWHDETLYRLATIIQNLAEAKHSASGATGVSPVGPRPAGSGSPASGPAKPLTAKDREAAAKADKDRLAALSKAKGEAIPFLREILKKYPKSPRCEQAFYSIGVLQYELAEAAPTDKAEQMFKDAAFTFNRFCETWPKSVYAGDAYVRQIDVALERLFDLKMAESLADAGGLWVKTWEDAAARPETKAASSPWQTRPRGPDEAAIKSVVYDLRLRGIFAAYFAEKFDKARQLLSAAGPLEPKDGRIDAEKVQKVGLFFLQKAVVAQKPIWNPDVLAKAKTDPQRAALKLADLYLKVVKPEKSADIYRRIIDKDPVFAPSLPSLELYACIQLARSYAYDQKNHEKAIDVLQTLYKPQFAKEPQLAEGLVWLGTLTYNFTQDPKKAMPHLLYVIKNDGDNPVAERAAYFYCIMAVATKDKTLAEDACKAFIAKYPGSTWIKHVTSLLNNEVAKLPTKERDRK